YLLHPQHRPVGVEHQCPGFIRNERQAEHAAIKLLGAIWRHCRRKRHNLATSEHCFLLCSKAGGIYRRTPAASIGARRGPGHYGTTTTRSVALRPKVSGAYISCALAGGATKLPSVVARAR